MKKILVIMGSPRKKGDGYKVIKTLEEELKRLGDVELDYLFLRDCDLTYCRGCLNCMRKGEVFCPLKDDAGLIKEKLLIADGVIFNSPVYVHTVTAIIKNFFDRFAFFCHRPAFHGKPALIVCTTELSGLPETIKYLEFPVQTWGFNIVNKLGIFSLAFHTDGQYRDRTLTQIKRTAMDFYSALQIEQFPIPNSFQTFFFNALKMKVTLHKDMLPYDYEYWKERGWLEEKHFYKTTLNPIYQCKALIKLKIMKTYLGKTLGIKL